MTQPLVTIVIETVTLLEGAQNGLLADRVAPTLAALDAQTYGRSTERILVLDAGISETERTELRRRYPGLRLIDSAARNYFAAKNMGACAASAELVALVDGDCVPEPGWLEALTARMAPGVAAVAGHTRYAGGSLAERIFSVPDFAYVLDEGGRASGLNLSNVLIRRETLLAFPLEPRIARHGGCYFLFHQLRAAGALMLYEQGGSVRHGNDVAGLGFVRKHFDRGYDSVSAYRLDRRAVLKGTRLFDRFGALVLPGFALRRTALDWVRLVRHRRDIGFPAWAVPFYWTVAAGLRFIELCGALTAITRGPVRQRA